MNNEYEIMWKEMALRIIANLKYYPTIRLHLYIYKYIYIYIYIYIQDLWKLELIQFLGPTI